MLRLPADGEPCECEREAAEIVGMAEDTNGMLEVSMEVADVDKMAVLDGKPTMRVCGVDKRDNNVEVCRRRTYIMKTVSTTKTSEITYLKHRDCRSRGSGQRVRATAQRAQVEVQSS